MTAQARTTVVAPEALRDLAEESAAQAKENLETMSAAAEEATDFLKHSFATTVKRTQDYNTKVLEFTNTNIKAAVEHATKLMSAKSPVEFFALSNEYAKRQFEIFTRQAQETWRNHADNDHRERPVSWKSACVR
jgi:phasin